MSRVRVLRQSFASGELAEALFGRVDFSKYQSGVAKCRNFITLPHGPAINRAGFRFIREVKNSANYTRLIPFSFNNSQVFAIEFGAGYIRFHAQSGTLMNGAVPYEVAHGYALADLADIKYVQSGDVITLTHPNYPVYELRRYSNLNWQMVAISFVAQVGQPTGVGASAYFASGVGEDFAYAVTALNNFGGEESTAVTSNTVVNDLTIQGNFNIVTWNPVAGASRYNVYKFGSGNYGFVAQTVDTSFKDTNITPDLSRTTPLAEPMFQSAGNYPSAVAYFEQRRFFAGTINQPMNIWGTQSGSNYNMNYSLPSQDSDALRFKIAAARANGIRHIVNLQDLILLTASTEFRVSSSSGALAPSSLQIKAQSQNGASNTTPVVVNNTLLYEVAQGGHIREMAYRWETSGYQSNDISLLAPHLFNHYTIKDMAFSRAPVPILWAVSTSGKLLGMTYVPEQQISAWHQHDTDGVFESCCTVTENDTDALYVIVRRTVNGQTKRYVERMDDRAYVDKSDAFFVDSGLSYSGPAVSTLSGLSHLEGKTVSILADGAVLNPQPVVNGAIQLPFPITKAHVGLPIVADLVTLPTYFNDPTFGQAINKNVNKVHVRVSNSGPFSAGSANETLRPVRMRTNEGLGTQTALYSGEYAIDCAPSWNATGQVQIQQADPLPLEITYIASEVSLGS